MKRIIILLIMLSFCSFGMEKCCDIFPKKSFTGVVSSVSGTNFLIKNLAQGQIKKALKKETGSKFKVKIENFWGVGLLSGVFKSIVLESKDFNYENFYVSKLKINSTAPVNKVKYENDEIYFCKDFGLEFNALITQDDVNKFISSSQYQEKIKKINTGFVKVKDTKIEILNDKLRIIYKISPFNLKTIKITLTSKIGVKDGKISLCEVNVNNKNAIPESIMPFVEKLYSFDWDLEANKNQKMNLIIEKAEIKNSKIEIIGKIKVL